MGRVVDDPDPRKEIAVDEAKKDDNKDERTKKPDEAKSGKDAERKKVQGGANNGRLYSCHQPRFFFHSYHFWSISEKKGFCWQVKPLYHSDAFAQRFVLWEQPFRQLDLVCELKKRR